jgi:uncharacterized repeat protein (TIGR03803 family)
MRVIFLTISFLGIGHIAILAQPVFYATIPSGGFMEQGTIVRFDASGDELTAVHSFIENAEGTHPFGSLTKSSNGKLYGMTSRGGGSNAGVLFSFDPADNAFSSLHEFDYANGGEPFGNSLFQGSDGKLYGMTAEGGSSDAGIIFSFDPSNNVFTKLHEFDIISGRYATGNLVESNGKLYGMTNMGGTNDVGVIFTYDPANSSFTKLHDFDIASGSMPFGSLTLASDGKLYGMAGYGGGSNGGVIFSVDPANDNFTKLHDFDIGSEYRPQSNFIEATDGKLYGVTQGGNGSLFSYIPSSGVLSVLVASSSDGFVGSLAQGSDGKLYGMTLQGGQQDNFYGTIFSYDVVTNQYAYREDFDEHNGAFPEWGSSLTEAAACIMPVAQVDNNGPLCTGDSLKLSASGGSAYSWSGPDGFISGIQNPVVAEMSQGNAGNYIVHVSNGPGCIVMATTTVVVNPLPAATISTSDPLSFCPNDSVTLTASTGSLWLWNNNATTQSITVKTPGDYTVKITGANNCSDISDTTTTALSPVPPTPTITGTPISFCEGKEVALTSSAAANYQWLKDETTIPGATNQSYTVSSDGEYSVIITNQEGCSATSDKIIITVNDNPVKPVLAWNGIQLSTTAGFTNYKWFRNGNEITDASANTYSPDESGKYKVTITNNNTCTATSDELDIVVTIGGNIIIGDVAIRCYPNPAKDDIFIDIMSSAPIKIRARLYDLHSRLITDQLLTSVRNNIKTRSLASGPYWMVFSDDKEKVVFKIVIIK